MRYCSVDGCGRPHYARGFCRPHYTRAARTGMAGTAEIRMVLRAGTSTKERFWNKVNKNGARPEGRPDLGRCWIWLGAHHEDGYGRVRVDGINRPAHAVAFEWAHSGTGPVDQYDHLCRTPSCVNPAHLEPVTAKENSRRGLNGVLKRTCVNGHAWIPENMTKNGFKRNGTQSYTCRIC